MNSFHSDASKPATPEADMSEKIAPKLRLRGGKIPQGALVRGSQACNRKHRAKNDDNGASL